MNLDEGTLFVVATPIGNLDDLSPRAREVLAGVDLIAAEDTRVTGRLLSHFGITGQQIALHEHNEAKKVASLIESLKDGKSVAIVSDAGTPLINDPGFLLIRAAHNAGVNVVAIPGPSAIVAALSVAGLPTDRFCYEGFLPAKSAARRKRLNALAGETRTLVFLESVHRIRDTVDDLIATFGADRQGSISRELTKMYEQCVTADLATLAARLADDTIPAKGEFVIVVTGLDDEAVVEQGVNADVLLTELVAVLPGKQAVEIVARLSGQSRNTLYQQMLALKAEK
jgi:16S rRNA (cytidine1402-2'-O)-methyltransferase